MAASITSKTLLGLIPKTESSPRPIVKVPPPSLVPAERKGTVEYKHKYYQSEESNTLQYYLNAYSVANSHDSILKTKIYSLMANENFKQGMGLARHPRCKNCTKDDPCPLLGENNVYDLIIEQYYIGKKDSIIFGKCNSCMVPLTMFDESKKISEQKISTWVITSGTACKTIKFLDKLRIFCRGCATLLELCYQDIKLFNHYRKVLFHGTGPASPGYYFPSLTSIDEKNRNVAIKSRMSLGGAKNTINLWKSQDGFPVYKVFDESLKNELLKDTERRDIIAMNNDANPQTKTSAYYGSDPDIKYPLRTCKISTEPGSTITIEELESKNKKRKPLKATSSRAKKSSAKEIKIPQYTLELDYIVFKIPMDPRKSMNKNLSAIHLSTIDTDSKMGITNCVMTTNLLNKLQKRFVYEDFLRWGLDCFRTITPRFEPKKTLLDKDLELSEEDYKELKNMSKRFETIKEKEKSISVIKDDIKLIDRENKSIIDRLNSKLINMTETGTDSKLKDFNLVAKISSRSTGSRMPKKLQVGLQNTLPGLITKYILGKEPDDQKAFSEKCQLIYQEFLDKYTVQEKTGIFTVTYVDPNVERKSKRRKTEENDDE